MLRGVAGATTTFHDDSFAGNSLITVGLGALVEFDDSSHAENATLVADGGTIKFADHSYGGFAAVVLTNHGALSLDQPDMPGITIGSIEGDSTAVLRMYEPLTVGLGGRSTTFAGLISQAGSLTKVGI